MMTAPCVCKCNITWLPIRIVWCRPRCDRYWCVLVPCRQRGGYGSSQKWCRLAGRHRGRGMGLCPYASRWWCRYADGGRPGFWWSMPVCAARRLPVRIAGKKLKLTWSKGNAPAQVNVSGRFLCDWPFRKALHCLTFLERGVWGLLFVSFVQG